jgi:hypothetical protein
VVRKKKGGSLENGSLENGSLENGSLEPPKRYVKKIAWERRLLVEPQGCGGQKKKWIIREWIIREWIIREWGRLTRWIGGYALNFFSKRYMEGCTHGQYQYTSRNKINLKI